MFTMTLSVSIILITIAVGYFVLNKANTQENEIKTFGKILAYLIIFTAIVLLPFTIYFGIQNVSSCDQFNRHPMMMHSMPGHMEHSMKNMKEMQENCSDCLTQQKESDEQNKHHMMKSK